jgi:hypothetical protein
VGDFFPYHGMLYGPAIAMSQIPVVGTLLPPAMASKLVGIVAFTAAMLMAWRACPGRAGRGYLLLLLPFGLYLFWNRAEPLFLLLVSLTVLIGSRHGGAAYLAVVAGLLAGAASALKIHGGAYVVAGYLAVMLAAPVAIVEVLWLGVGAIAGFLVFFAPGNVSLEAFFEYLQLAARHGISLVMWLENVFYLVFLLAPLAIAWTMRRRDERVVGLRIAGILLLEFAVTVLAAKPGSGIHHLLPFIPANAYLMHRLTMQGDAERDPRLGVMYALVAVPAIAGVLAVLMPMARTWKPLEAARQELVRFSGEHPGLVMGVSDSENYRYSFLRVVLPGEQVEYGAYMDLQFSGVGAESLVAKMRSCGLRNVVLPREGAPFTLDNVYDAKPLFPDAVRAQFAASYQKVAEGDFFSVYSCRAAAP